MFLKSPASIGWGGEFKEVSVNLSSAIQHQGQGKFSSLVCTALLPCGAHMLSLLAVNISEGTLEEGTCNYVWDDIALTWPEVLCMHSNLQRLELQSTN